MKCRISTWISRMTRAMMLEYCTQKYGADKVAQIITFGTMGARAALKDVGRVMEIPLSEVDRVSKPIRRSLNQVVYWRTL